MQKIAAAPAVPRPICMSGIVVRKASTGFLSKNGKIARPPNR